LAYQEETVMDETTTVAGEQLLLRPVEAARQLGIGRTKLYELMASGQLRSVKIGGARRVSATALAEFVAALDAA
jgi:excisionase family DNA binding protein